jgi:GDP-L-fucose synthase
VEKDWLTTPFTLRNKTIWVAGHRGMVGSSLVRRLQSEDCKILTSDFDLRVQADVSAWMRKNNPQIVVIAAAKVGGILANATYPADFFHDNLSIQNNIITAAHETGVEKLLFLGSSCIYPKDAPQPVKEEYLLSGPLEATNEAYAVAKIAGLKLCAAYRAQHGDDFISVMPCNLYGPGDKFDAQNSHVIPALMMKAHEAKLKSKNLEVWGSGTPRREFLFVDDLADALVFALKNYSLAKPLNIGSGADIKISELVAEVAQAVGFKGTIIYDRTKPDGTMRKLMDSSRIFDAGWKPQTDLKTGLRKTYDWFKKLEEVRDAA